MKLIFNDLENIRKEKRDSQKVVSLYFDCLNRLKIDFDILSVSDMLMGKSSLKYSNRFLHKGS